MWLQPKLRFSLNFLSFSLNILCFFFLWIALKFFFCKNIYFVLIYKYLSNIKFFFFYCYTLVMRKWEIWYNVMSQPHSEWILYRVLLHCIIIWNLNGMLYFFLFYIVTQMSEINWIFNEIYIHNFLSWDIIFTFYNFIATILCRFYEDFGIKLKWSPQNSFLIRPIRPIF